MSWASRRRTIYISGVVGTLLILIGVPLYFIIDKPPTCFDGKRNADERGVDCGGSCALICPFEIVPPTVLWSRSFKITDGVYNAVAYIEHPNQNAGVLEAPYRLTLLDAANILITEREGTTFLLPNTLTPVFEGGISVGERIPTRTRFEFTGPLSWVRTAETESSLTVRGQRLINIETVPRINATIENQSVKDIFDLEVVGVVFDVNDNAIAASETFIPILESKSSYNVVFTWPEPFTTRVERCTAAVDVMLAIDVSGSMNNDGLDPPQPLTDAKNAASDFVSRLTKNDRIGLVSFATNSKIERNLSVGIEAMRSAVESLLILPEEEVGSTNTGDAIKEAVFEFESLAPREEGSKNEEEDRKILILLTDGLANEPEDPGGEPHAIGAASDAKAADIAVYTIGLGDQVNTGFLRDLASEPKKYYQAARSRDLDLIYREISEDICERGPAIIDVIPKGEDLFIPLTL